jgi:hypothetical protein
MEQARRVAKDSSVRRADTSPRHEEPQRPRCNAEQLGEALVEACPELLDEVSGLQRNGDLCESNGRTNACSVPGTRHPDNGQAEGHYAGNAEAGRADQNAPELITHSASPRRCHTAERAHLEYDERQRDAVRPQVSSYGKLSPMCAAHSWGVRFRRTMAHVSSSQRAGRRS